jgi:hypothetical protein
LPLAAAQMFVRFVAHSSAPHPPTSLPILFKIALLREASADAKNLASRENKIKTIML